MDPQTQFCHNLDCPGRGQIGQGNIKVHSRKERRYRCNVCRQTFAASKGTPFYRLRIAMDIVTTVLILLCHGCPIQAIVAAFGLDERTVADWQGKAGQHCQRLHEHLVQQEGIELGQVQADELWVKIVNGRVWMAMALAIPFRLWLGGVISPSRDLVLISKVAQMVRLCARSLAILVCVDGLAGYVTAFRRVFRNPIQSGCRGRPRLVLAEGLLMGQVIKRYAHRRVVSVSQRIVRGTAAAISAALAANGGSKGINTAYIERLNATFRSALVQLVRRGRAIARKQTTLRAAMYLVGCAYNFCWYHQSLRLAAPAGASHKWQEQTPAMAAGLADHCWGMLELLQYQIPLPAYVMPKRRGRPPKRIHQPVIAVAA